MGEITAYMVAGRLFKTRKKALDFAMNQKEADYYEVGKVKIKVIGEPISVMPRLKKVM